MLEQVYMQYIINFEKYDDIVDHLVLFQDKLQPFFEKKAYTIVGIPDGIPVPPEMARIIAVSSNGHSSLEVSLSQIRLSTKFDSAYAGNRDKCLEYIEKRINIINKIAETVLDHKIFFNGIVSQFIDSDIQQPKEYILDHQYQNSINRNKLFDIFTKLTYIDSDRYYINLSFNNLRKDKIKENFGVQLDVNNRYFSNFNRDHKYADKELIDGTLELYTKIVQNPLENLIEGKLSI